MRSAKIVVFPGDGIGLEVTRQAQCVATLCAERYGLELNWIEGCIGGAAIDRSGNPLPDESLALAASADAVFLGAVGGPKWDDPRSRVRPEQALLGLRRGLELFGNLRPIAVSPLLRTATPIKAEFLDGVDILFVRELTGGVYFGQPSERRVTSSGRDAVDTVVYSEKEIVRVVRLGFELARARRGRLSSVDKANILATSRLWREIVHEIAREFPEVACSDVLVDAMAMHLIRRPRDFDVVVTENMFGDILTDEASVLAGSLGMLPSASLGDRLNSIGGRLALYEPVHGSAPDIAGKDLANPLGAILSVAMMFRHSLLAAEAARAIETAVDHVLAQGLRTADVQQEGCQAVGCCEMGEAVCERVKLSA
jgi:3-isopropylmalate dehydrogenase